MQTGRMMAAFLALAVAAGPAFADPPWENGHGGGHGGPPERHDQRGPDRHDGDRHDADRHDGDRHGPPPQHEAHGRDDHGRGHPGPDRRFGDHDRTVVHQYYEAHYRKGCPPGLARKHNGCMPPGHARRWEVGHPLPRDVTYYAVPQQLVVELGAPPAGYRYVRVASDILMIAVGTGLVVDAIQDLGG